MMIPFMIFYNLLVTLMVCHVCLPNKIYKQLIDWNGLIAETCYMLCFNMILVQAGMLFSTRTLQRLHGLILYGKQPDLPYPIHFHRKAHDGGNQCLAPPRCYCSNGINKQRLQYSWSYSFNASFFIPSYVIPNSQSSELFRKIIQE